MVAMEPSSASSETPERKGGKASPGTTTPGTATPGKAAPGKAAPGRASRAKGTRARAARVPSTRKRAAPKQGGDRGEEATGPGAPTGSRADGSHDESTGSVTGGVRYRGRGRNLALYSRAFQRNFEHWPLATRGVAALLRHPEPVLALLGAREPVERDGRVLNRNTQAMLELVRRFDVAGQGPSVDGETPDLPTRRRQLRLGARIAMPTRTDVHVSGRVVPGGGGSPPIPVRVYRQFGTGVGIGDPGRERPPAIVYFHGGGWVVGDLDTHDGTCRLLAAASRCLVVSVDYRLAPEHPFPAAVDDCLTAYAWVHANSEELGFAPGQVGVMGDSAGGNLAAVVAQQTRDGSTAVPPPVAQGLVYPAVDAMLSGESLLSMGDGFSLTLPDIERFRGEYLPDPADWEDPRASPLLAGDLAGVAPALVVTAGFDPLRDDGARYAEALRRDGVAVEYRCYQDQIHGFLGMGILPDSLGLATEVCDAMGRLVRRSAGRDVPARD